MNDLKQYIDLKVDELKLRATKGLSVAMGRLVAMFLIIGLLLIVLSLMAVVLIQWLAELTGSMFIASAVVCGVFSLVLVVLLMLRKRLFRNTFVKLFIQIFYGEK